MSRNRARLDSNQTAIVKALRQCGCSVLSLANMGKGCPDILVAKSPFHSLYLAEIKDGSKPPSKQKLTADEEKFHQSWKSHIYILHSVDDALKMIGAK